VVIKIPPRIFDHFIDRFSPHDNEKSFADVALEILVKASAMGKANILGDQSYRHFAGLQMQEWFVNLGKAIEKSEAELAPLMIDKSIEIERRKN